MTIDDWRRVQELFDRTLEQPPYDRTGFLLSSQADPIVRAAVESLLLHHERLGDAVLNPDLDAVPLAEERRPAGSPERPETAAAGAGEIGMLVADRYVLERELGRGGTSVVYVAQDRHLPNRRCVVKILNQHSAHPALFDRKFQEEIDAQVLLEGHEGIVTVSDKGRLPDGRPYFVMQHVDGTTLRAELQKGPILSDRVAQIVRQVGHALRFAHLKGICHLDLKPGNVILQDVDSGSMRVWVIDFGTAKIASAGATAHTTTTTAIGTPPYMAPEQYMGRMSPASDVYALATMTFELLTGARPDEDDRKQLERLKAGKKSAQLKYPLRVTTQLLLAEALAFDPAQRPDDVAGFADKLAASLSGREPEIETAAFVMRRGRRPKRRYAAGIAVGVAALLAIGAAALWLALRTPSAPTRLTVEQLTTLPGSERFPSLAPDGSQVAFAWGGADDANIDLYVQRLAGGPSLRLTTNPAVDSLPAWSPDGGLIAFVRLINGEAAVHVTMPVPGAERKLAQLRPSSSQIYLMNLSWSPDGRWLATDARDGTRPAVVLVSANDGAQRVLMSNPAPEGSYCFAEFSPTGKWIAFAHCRGKDGVTNDTDPCDLYVLALDDKYQPRGQPRQLTRQGSPIRGISWLPDERSLVYGSSGSGDMRLWRVGLSGEPPERLDATFKGEFPTIARAGGKLVYSHEYSDEWDIWTLQPNAAPLRVLSSTRSDHDPQLSPDGTKVAFVTTRSGRGREIWVAGLDGVSAAPVMKATGKDAGSPRWSPDGRWLAFDAQSGNDGNWDIYVVDAEGGQPRRLTTDPGFENFPSWSRDGNWIYFRSMRSGRSEVWRMSPAGGEPAQMTTTGAAAAWESWTGDTLYYTRHDGQGPAGTTPQLFARSLKGGPERQVLDGVLRWDFIPVRGGIYFILPVDDRMQRSLELRFLDTGTGKTRTVTRFQALIGQGLSASGDGRTILYSGRAPEIGADLMLVDNFR